jgi:hypothetical protein
MTRQFSTCNPEFLPGIAATASEIENSLPWHHTTQEVAKPDQSTPVFPNEQFKSEV